MRLQSYDGIEDTPKMAMYRVYQLDGAQHIKGPPAHLDCSDDDEAIAKSEAYLNGHGVEIWQESRLVKKLDPSGTSK